jgi:CheY-like chemotaxis protein
VPGIPAPAQAPDGASGGAGVPGGVPGLPSGAPGGVPGAPGADLDGGPSGAPGRTGFGTGDLDLGAPTEPGARGGSLGGRGFVLDETRGPGIVDPRRLPDLSTSRPPAGVPEIPGQAQRSAAPGGGPGDAGQDVPGGPGASHAQDQSVAQGQGQGLAQGQLPGQAQAHGQAQRQGQVQTHAQPQAPATPSLGRAISVHTLGTLGTHGQGMAFVPPEGGAEQARPAPVPHQAQPTSGPGRRRRLNAPVEPDSDTGPRPHPQLAERRSAAHDAAAPEGYDPLDPQTAPLRPVPSGAADDSEGGGRAYAIGAPAEGDEGPEPLDGPNGAVDVTDSPRRARGGPLAVVPDLPDHPADPAARDDHAESPGSGDVDGDAPPPPLAEPRRLLVWPEPDVSTRQALTDRGYRPVIVRSREEVDAQVAEPPAALFVDPLTGPITRTALQSLRQAAERAEVPVLVTAGLGQATREAAYGADPAVLLKALAPRDSDQHPPRVLLVESHEDIAHAFTATLERRGMQVAHAPSEADAMNTAAQAHPNLVVMDLMLVRRRRHGIVDWLRAQNRLTRTPLVVYTSVDIDPAELPRLASGETVLFLAERSTSPDVQSRIVDLLSKIGS